MLAHFTQTANGIRIEDVRFKGAKGNTMSALVYIPANATEKTPAPGILAVHGYLNSRETQDGFAIEFARRGYVVVALDQTGHGYSDPPAIANGFGGPDGLAYLRSLPYVDKNNIGLEGHSMGGWTVLAAATAMPDAYRSIVLEGSSIENLEGLHLHHCRARIEEPRLSETDSQATAVFTYSYRAVFDFFAKNLLQFSLNCLECFAGFSGLGFAAGGDDLRLSETTVRIADYFLGL